MRRFILLGLGLNIVMMTAGCSGETGSRSHPNILLITVDTLRTDRLSCYGGPPGNTPNIDGLAATGVQFASVQAPRGLTWPSLTTLLTGLHPRTHGVRANGQMLGAEYLTLPELLELEGYETGGFLANMCDAPNRGLQTFFCAWWEKEGRPERIVRKQWASHEQPQWDQAITARAVRFIREPRDRPFFAWVHYIDPHKPFDVVEEHVRDVYDGSFATTGDNLNARTLDQKPLTAEEREQLLAVYDSQITAVDAHIGRLLEALAQTGQDGDTLVVFTADHGEELGDHNVYFYHLSSVYEQVLSIPLILRWPGQLPRGHDVEQPIAAIDVTPTVLDLLSLPARVSFEGAARTALARGDREAIGAPFTLAEWTDRIVIVGEGDWRYVFNPDRFAPRGLPWSTVEGKAFRIEAEELYNLSQDPRQQRNIIDDHPDRSAAMRRRACEFITEKDFHRQARRALADDVLERLESLGYLQGEEDVPVSPGIDRHCPAGES